ncbi:hypothetical protein TraAM80_05009 [Trypanosoma rangeli]|uniref:Uncharacterized protein n=1 Tax=Trypanosoma rangeli TaxID=5698 RepID=A0A3S5IR58_TRYRA|nr:uncharacterized protein TraAM80_05009 [Trypanosoma rangeli]RNF04607.1 hypothetical protein TraAM80_05009 [Trypanosoma rangeli]|eukprot:RNF04607.1 hypothetical protein TraAM80_05009 [Trypanosoma rangeli]
MTMEEASTLIAWGRQVLTNRRLQKQRERLQHELGHLSDAAPLVNPGGARHSPVPEVPDARGSSAVAASFMMDNLTPDEHRERQPLECRGDREGVSPNRLHPYSKASLSSQGAMEVMQLERRIEVAKQSLQELRGLESHNAETFRRRMQDLRSMLQQVELCRDLRHAPATDFLGEKLLGQPTFDSATAAAATPHQQRGQPKLDYKEQLEELWLLQKATLKSLHDEKVVGVAVASLTACAGDVQNWDGRLWRLLREAAYNWKLRLMPSLHHFLGVVQQLPMLQQPEEHTKINPTGSRPECSENVIALNVPIGSVTDLVKPPAAEDYPALEWLDNLPLQEAIDVVVDVLARAGADTEASLASLIYLSDQKDVQLANLLGEAEEQLQRQGDALEEAHTLIGRLQEAKASLEEDGVDLHDAVELLQEKVVALRSKHEERQRQDAERREELQRHQTRIHELEQSLGRQTSLRNEVVRRTDETKRSMEDTARETTLLHDELQRATERQNSVEEEVLRLRRLLRLAKLEEEEATRQGERQSDELHVAQLASQASREAFMRRKQRQEEDQKTLMSIRCSTHEVLSRIQTEEEACADYTKEIDTQKAVAAAVLEELVAIQAETREANKELAAVQRSLRVTNEKLKAAQMALLYQSEVSSAVTGDAVASTTPPSQRNLVEVLLPKNGGAKKKKSPAALHLNTSHSSEFESSGHTTRPPLSQQEQKTKIMPMTAPLMLVPQLYSSTEEMALAPRGIPRQEGELRMEQSHLLVSEPQRKRGGFVPSEVSKVGSPVLLSPGENGERRAPLVVSLPPRHDRLPQ